MTWIKTPELEADYIMSGEAFCVMCAFFSNATIYGIQNRIFCGSNNHAIKHLVEGLERKGWIQMELDGTVSLAPSLFRLIQCITEPDRIGGLEIIEDREVLESIYIYQHRHIIYAALYEQGKSYYFYAHDSWEHAFAAHLTEKGQALTAGDDEFSFFGSREKGEGNSILLSRDQLQQARHYIDSFQKDAAYACIMESLAAANGLAAISEKLAECLMEMIQGKGQYIQLFQCDKADGASKPQHTLLIRTGLGLFRIRLTDGDHIILT